MIRNIKRRWFEVWGDEEAQNRILKYLLLIFSALMGLELATITVLAMRKPIIISSGAEATRVIEPQNPDANTLLRELMRVLKQYLRARHNWDWNNIEAQSRAAGFYVAPEFREKFMVSQQEQIRVAKEKQVTQKMYPDDPKIDLKARTAEISAERILIVNGIRAAQFMKFGIGFSFGDRTEDNPEGIYITSEKLEPLNGS